MKRGRDGNTYAVFYNRIESITLLCGWSEMEGEGGERERERKEREREREKGKIQVSEKRRKCVIKRKSEDFVARKIYHRFNRDMICFIYNPCI